MSNSFHDVAATFIGLKEKFQAGEISRQQFIDEMKKLRLKDDQGRYWMIGAQTGKWYYFDGNDWIQSEPPSQKENKAICIYCGFENKIEVEVCARCGGNLIEGAEPADRCPQCGTALEKPLLICPKCAPKDESSGTVEFVLGRALRADQERFFQRRSALGGSDRPVPPPRSGFPRNGRKPRLRSYFQIRNRCKWLYSLFAMAVRIGSNRSRRNNTICPFGHRSSNNGPGHPSNEASSFRQ